MTLPTFDEFRAQAQSLGYDEVLERVWSPGTVLAEHTHPFDAHAIVAQGTMWLDEGQGERRLGPGDSFTLARDTPHSERYGEEGATYWVARRNG